MSVFADPQYSQDVGTYSSAVAAQLGSQAGLLALAQANLETGNGQKFSTLYNFGNIGNTDSNPTGGPNYSSPAAAANAYVQFLQSNSRYSKYLADAKAGASAATLALDIAAAHWATDPNYASKLLAQLAKLGTTPAAISAALGAAKNAAAGVPNSPASSSASSTGNLTFGEGIAYYGITVLLVLAGLGLVIGGIVLLAKEHAPSIKVGL